MESGPGARVPRCRTKELRPGCALPVRRPATLVHFILVAHEKE